MIVPRVVLIVLPTLLMPPGCNSRGGRTHAASAKTASVVASASAAPAEVRRAPRPFRSPGLAGLALNASHDLQLSDAQTASVDAIHTALATAEAEAHAGDPRFQADIAASIKAGRVDSNRLSADYAAIDKAKLVFQRREMLALDGLHAALESAQRSALVAGLREKEHASDAQKAPEVPDGGVSERTKQTLERLTQKLDLDASQQRRLAAILSKDDKVDAAEFPKRREATKRRLDAFLSAFEQSEFDASKLESVDEPGKTPHDAQQRQAGFIGQLLGLLTPEQRSRLVSSGHGPTSPPMPPHGPVHRAGPGGFAEPPRPLPNP